jgi:Subtilase family
VYKTLLSFIRPVGFILGMAAIFTACQTTIPAAPPTSSRAQGFGGFDPLYGLQRNNYELMNLEQAWSVTQGSSSIRIAVLDNGIAPHPDLDGQWTRDTNGGLNIDAFLSGRIDYDPSINTGDYFHGTHVAGIVAAAQGNGGGIGVCPNCQLLPIKFEPYRITDAMIAYAVRYVAGEKIEQAFSTAGLERVTVSIPGSLTPRARVINMSFSGKAPCAPEVAAAIQVARAKGVIVVASVGNLNNSRSIEQASDMTPANCPGVISVGSLTSTRQLSNFSNLGATILAPGGDDIADPATGDINYFGAFLNGCNVPNTGTNAQNGILSTYAAPSQSNCYRYLHGTSMATPMVSGVIGLMLSREPNLTPDQITQRLTSTATRVAGGLLVNAAAALGVQTPPQGTINAPCENLGTANCVFDSRSLGWMPDGSFVESISAYGKIWNFDLNGNPSAGNKTDIRSVARYASGPCAFAPVGQPCTFDTRTLFNYPGVGFVESITAYGRAYNFDSNGNPWDGNGTDLRNVARFAFGPCAFAPDGQPCTFDTRTLVNYPDVGFVESITAYGKAYNFDINGNEWIGRGNGTDLRAVARYASGPCAFAPAGQPCTFDTRTLIDYPGVGFVESITAYGQAYNFDANGNPWAGNGTDLKSVPRFASGPKAAAAKTNISLPRYLDPCSTPYDVDLRCEITKNYIEVLARRPGDAELQYWLNSGISGQALREQFAYSQEAKNLIQTISRACLLRDADQNSLATWQYYMLRGGSIVNVASIIATSAESNQKGNPCTLTSNIQ